MLPPTIPTSFVPHSASAGAQRGSIDTTNIFGFLSYFILVVVFALAIGVFSYGRILSASESAKNDALAKEAAKINPATVEGFVRLRDRLLYGEKLLNGHVAFSSFFTSLGKLTPTTGRFSSVNLSIDDTGAIKLDGSGTAKSFNALASASIAFANDGRVKNAIFSNIKVNPKDSSVSFGLSAMLDPKIVLFSPSVPVAPSISTASTSSATSTSSRQATSTKPTL